MYILFPRLVASSYMIHLAHMQIDMPVLKQMSDKDLKDMLIPMVIITSDPLFLVIKFGYLKRV